MQVLIRQRAERSIDSIAHYISGQGYPETAFMFISRLKGFLYKTADFPRKHPICHQKSYAKRGFRCAVFEKNFIVVYKVYASSVFIQNVIHVAKLR